MSDEKPGDAKTSEYRMTLEEIESWYVLAKRQLGKMDDAGAKTVLSAALDAGWPDTLTRDDLIMIGIQLNHALPPLEDAMEVLTDFSDDVKAHPLYQTLRMATRIVWALSMSFEGGIRKRYYDEQENAEATGEMK